MVNQLAEDVAAGLGSRIQPTYGYYRQPNGWITVSPITRLERVKYIEEGWAHLGQYGAFDLTTYGIHHPFEGLFMFGGAHEMPVEQVVQMGLYLNPPLVPRCRQHITQYHRSHNAGCWAGAQPVVFPQMADVPDAMKRAYPCEFCSRQLPTAVAQRQHQSVAHAEDLGRLNTGETMGKALATALQKVKPARTRKAARRKV